MDKTLQVVTTGAPAVLISSVVSSFIENETVRPSSRRTYERSLRQFFQWVTDTDRELSELARPDIVSYRDDLLTSGKSPLTVSNYLAAVRKFFSWCEASRYCPNIAKGVPAPVRHKTDGTRKKALGTQEARELLQCFEGRDPRDYALVSLMLRCGLRVIEASRADVGDVERYGNRRILRLHGKGRDEKREFVVLTDKAYAPIRAYLDSRCAVKDSEPLFLSQCGRNRGGRLSRRAISRIVKQGLQAIGLDERYFTAHSCRHTTACSILRAGGRLEDAQNVLRHSSPVTTQVYLATIKEEQRLSNPAEALLDDLL